MRVDILYVKGHTGSEEQANVSLESFLDHGWDAKLVPGVTPETLDSLDLGYDLLPESRLSCFKKENERKYRVKRSCVTNNLLFAKRVLEAGEPMVFAEHDSVCIAPPADYEFQDFLFLAFDHAFHPPTCLSEQGFITRWRDQFERQNAFTPSGVYRFPKRYPLLYKRPNKFKGAQLPPGTAAYVLSPTGAEKLLDTAEKNGIEQSDMIINSMVMTLEYLSPSPVKYAEKNLNLSHKL